MDKKEKMYIDIVIYIVFAVFSIIASEVIENFVAKFVSIALATISSIVLKINSYNNITLVWISRFIYRRFLKTLFFICFYILAVLPTVLKAFNAKNTDWTVCDILAESFLTNITATTLCVFIIKYISDILSEEQLRKITPLKNLNEVLSSTIGFIIPLGTYIFIRYSRKGLIDNQSRIDLTVNWFFWWSFLAF